MVTSNILYAQKSETKNENAKLGIDIYFNQLEKTDTSIYRGIFPDYKRWRSSMIYFGAKLSAEIKDKLLKTDLEIVRGNELRVNYGRQNTTTDFAFILNNYESKKPVIVGTVRMSKENANLFSYKTSVYDNNVKDYVNLSEKTISAQSQEELINKVAVELKSDI
jgi:hypothetical protein